METDRDGRARIRLAAPRLGAPELAAVEAVFRSGQLTKGPATDRFEAEFAQRHGVEHGVAFANGTVALTALYLALGIGPGDEVIVPSMTFISSATSVLHAGAVPAFADVNDQIFTLDPEDVARRSSPRTKAVLAVHYGGQAADLAGLAAVADEVGAILLEDAAEAHGCTYDGRPVGSIGRAGVFSFTPTKNLTTGEGGMVTTDDGALAGRLRLLRDHGQTGPYEHALLGYNWRLSDIQAAIGSVQLSKLDRVLARNRAVAGRLTERLEAVDGVRPPVTAADRDHAFMLYTVLIDDGRDQVMAALREAGIESRLYFPPAHRQPVFAGLSADLPVTDWLAEKMLSLPCHPGVSDDDVDEVVDEIARVLG